MTIVTPALGPSLGIAPGGDVHVELLALERALLDAELLGVAAHVGEGDPRRLLHHVAQLAGEHQAVARRRVPGLHRGGLDEQHVAARARDRQSGGDTGRGGPCGGLLEELLAAERVAHDLQVDLHGGC